MPSLEGVLHVSSHDDRLAVRWYTMEIQVLGDQMQVSLDGKRLGALRSPGIAHPTKQSVHFTVNGKETHFDDVKIWEATR